MGGRGRQEGGDRRRVGTGSLLLYPHPAPGSAPAASAGCPPRRRLRGAGAREAAGRVALTAASRSDAARAAGAALLRAPGHGRGAGPQRHFSRCTLLQRSRSPSTPLPVFKPLFPGPYYSPSAGLTTPPARPHFTTLDLLSITPHCHPARLFLPPTLLH